MQGHANFGSLATKLVVLHPKAPLQNGLSLAVKLVQAKMNIIKSPLRSPGLLFEAVPKVAPKFLQFGHVHRLIVPTSCCLSESVR